MAADRRELMAMPSTQQQFNRQQIDIIKSQIAVGASDDELAYFLEVARLTGLNPLQRQIYAIMRNSKDDDGKSAKKMTIQTGIDGYRLMAARTGELAGIDDPVFDTEEDEHPNKAAVTVWRFVHGQRVPFTASARWTEYKQGGRDKNGKEYTSGLWLKMPYLMLGKCAEALALRKAFPAELSGLYTAEEMSQADSEQLPYVEPASTSVRPMPAADDTHKVVTPQITKDRARLQTEPNAETHFAFTEDAPERKATKEQLKRITKACELLGRDVPTVVDYDHAAALLAAYTQEYTEMKAKADEHSLEGLPVSGMH